MRLYPPLIFRNVTLIVRFVREDSRSALCFLVSRRAQVAFSVILKDMCALFYSAHSRTILYITPTNLNPCYLVKRKLYPTYTIDYYVTNLLMYTKILQCNTLQN